MLKHPVMPRNHMKLVPFVFCFSRPAGTGLGSRGSSPLVSLIQQQQRAPLTSQFDSDATSASGFPLSSAAASATIAVGASAARSSTTAAGAGSGTMADVEASADADDLIRR